MRGFARSFLAAVALLVHPIAAQADGPVALVESISGAPTGVEFMDYLSTGQVIALREKEALVISYLQSCMRETITGGTVTIGTERSAIKGGTLESERIHCDGGQLKLSPEQSGKSAGMVSRFSSPKIRPLPPGTVIERRLYGASPIVDLGGGDRIVIERLDRSEDRLDLVLPADRLMRGRFYDFAIDDQGLAAGGIYRATVGHHSIVFQIDRSAKPGKAPIAGRLLVF